MKRRNVLMAVLAVGAAQTLNAQTFPSRPVRMIVPYSPGGGTDNVGRLMCDELQRALQQSFIVDNRVGANGRIGTDLVAKSAPDGYTLLLGGIGPLTIAPHLEHVPYDPDKDFSPITLIGTADSILIVNPSVPAENLPELLEYLRRSGGKANYGSSGLGGPFHMAGELLKTMAKVEMTHVPYKGDGAALIDLMGGAIQLMFTSVSAGLPHVKAGKVRIVASAGERRTPLFPDIKTIAEQGLPGFSADSWVGVFGPAGMPARTVEVLHSAMARILADEPVKQKLMAQGITPVGSGPSELKRFVKSEYDKWGQVIRERGLKGS